MTSAISFEGVCKQYKDHKEAVSSLNLEVADGEFTVLVGPSGCGKTTALRMVAGLEEITSGVLRIGGRVVNNTSVKDRNVAMVFQNYALYPHMTVAENIGFALKVQRVDRQEIQRRVTAAAKVLGLAEYLDRRPKDLSGGQRQRVAMGRAIVRAPQVFLMDEPLSNLDAKLRVQMRGEVLKIQRRLGIGTLYVTHDQVEAMTMGDRVAVMDHGVLQQYAPPQELYDAPANVFVAGFIGSPPMNLYQATLARDTAGPRLVICDQVLALDENELKRHPLLDGYLDQPVIVGIRPEDLSMAVADESASVLHADVEFVEGLGCEILVHFSIGADAVPPLIRGTDTSELLDGVAALEEMRPAATGTAKLSPHAIVYRGDRIALRVDVSRLHFFDPVSGQSLRGS